MKAPWRNFRHQLQTVRLQEVHYQTEYIDIQDLNCTLYFFAITLE